MYNKRLLQKTVTVNLPNNKTVKINRNLNGKFECKCGANLKKPQSLQRHWTRCATAMAQSETSESSSTDARTDSTSASSTDEDAIENQTILQKTLQELHLGFDTERNLIICQKCKCLLKPSSIVNHLYRIHNVRNSKPKIQQISGHLPTNLDPNYLEPTANGIDPIEGN